MSWVKRADHAPATGGKTWQEFQQEHPAVPYTEGIQFTVDKILRGPYLSQLPPEILREMYESRAVMEDVNWQEHIRKLTGMIIPFEKMESFLQKLEMAYNARIGQ